MSSDDPATLRTNALLQATLAVARTDETAQSEERWRHVRALHRRWERAIFDRAAAWCTSAIALDRALGADVLAQLGASRERAGSPFAAESGTLVAGLLDDSDPRVIRSALYALGHLGGGAPAGIARHAAHPSAEVRHAVAYALGGRNDDVSVATLIALTDDEDEDVRDWATFGLGSLCTADGPGLREALVMRLLDVDADVRGEAIAGLAARGDVRAIDPILLELTEPEVDPLWIEAAGKLLEAHPKHDALRRALAACRRKAT